MAFPGRLEIAPGADREAHSFTWAWTDITADVQQHSAQLQGGRANEAARTDPATLAVRLNNDGGMYTPKLATSSLYPDWGKGVPMRYSVQAGNPYLLLPGTGARLATPDAASLDAVGDIFAAVEVWSPHHHYTDTGTEVFGKFNVTGNQRSWVLFLGVTGTLRLRWSTDGTGAGEKELGSEVALPKPAAGPIAFGVYLDVNDGGDHSCTFYYRRGSLADLVSAITAGDETVLLGPEVIGAGTTSIFASTANLGIGDVEGSGFNPFLGMVRRAVFRSGDHTGTVLANPDLTVQAAGATSFADTAATPKTWTVVGDAEITDYHPRFLGEVSSVKPRWPGHGVDGTAEVEVVASGVLRRLRQGEDPLRSALYRAVTSPLHAAEAVDYWPHEDGADSVRLANALPGGGPLTIRGEFTLAADATLPGSGPLLQLSSGQRAYMSGRIRSIPQVAGVSWQVTRLYKTPEGAAAATPTRLMAVDTNGRVRTWRVAVDVDGLTISGVDIDGASVVSTGFADDPTFFDQWVMAVLTVTDDGADVDWRVSLIPIPGGVEFFTTGTFVGNTGVPYYFRNGLVGAPQGTSVGHLIVSSGTSVGWLAPADTGYVGETAVARIERLCSEEAIPLDVHSTDLVASEALGPQRPLPLTQLLEECADADLGLLTESRMHLGFHYRPRGTRYNQVHTWDPAGGLVMPFGPDDDDRAYRNDVTVSRPEGSEARAVDEAEVTAQGRYTDAPSVNVATDDRLPAQAGWRLHQGTWPQVRHESLTVNVAKDADLEDGWLSVAPGDELVTSSPLPEYPDTEIAQVVEGWTEQISAHDWPVTLHTSPAGVWQIGVRDDDVLGRRDTAGSVLDADFDAGTDTSMDVETTLGPLWTQVAGHFPFDLNVGGARVTVSAIGAPTGQVQTFTVSATIVNGVAKTVPAGTAVHLWRRSYRAL